MAVKELNRPKSAGQNFVDDNQVQIWPVFYNDISFCKPSMKSMHPCKSYWAETNINTTTKTKPKKGHNSAKILLMITDNGFDLYFTFIYPSANLMKLMHPF